MRIEKGQLWRRRKDGALFRVHRVLRDASGEALSVGVTRCSYHAHWDLAASSFERLYELVAP